MVARELSPFESRIVQALSPSPTPLTDEVWQWAPFANSPHQYYFRVLGEMACKVNVQKSHDPLLIAQFLKELTQEQLLEVSAANPLKSFASTVLGATPFELRAIAHPSISNGSLAKATQFMAATTYTTFPIYRAEMDRHDTAEDQRHRVAKILPWSDWTRGCAPAVKMRFHRTKTNIKSLPLNQRAIVKFQDIEKVLGYLGKDNGFAEIENFEHDLRRIECNEGAYFVVTATGQSPISLEALLPMLRAFAIDGATNR